MSLLPGRPGSWLGFVLLLLPSLVVAQDVISVRSGFIFHTEGQVLMGDEVVKLDPARKLHLAPGKRLRTEDGRAEMMLALGTLVRLDKNSELEMINAGMTSGHARVIHGAAIIDAARVFDPDSISLTTTAAKVAFPIDGYYRIDAQPGRPVTLKVYKGKAIVSSEDSKIQVKSKKVITLSESPAEWAVAKFDRKEKDPLEHWSQARTKTIEETNRTLMARGEDDPRNGHHEKEMLRLWLESQRQRSIRPPSGYGGGRGGASGGGASEGGASGGSGGGRSSPGRSRGR